MKKVAAFVLVLGFASSAFAGTVTFTEIPAGSNVVEVGVGGDVQFEVRLDMDSLTSFNLANIIIGSDTLTVSSLEYAQSWRDLQAFPLSAPVPAGMYASDLFGGGFLSAASTTGQVVGMLTVHAGADLALGDYTVMVDSERDFGTSQLGLNAEGEGLFGIGTVHVTPEPATLILLGIGGVAAIRRRRR